MYFAPIAVTLSLLLCLSRSQSTRQKAFIILLSIVTRAACLLQQGFNKSYQHISIIFQVWVFVNINAAQNSQHSLCNVFFGCHTLKKTLHWFKIVCHNRLFLYCYSVKFDLKIKIWACRAKTNCPLCSLWGGYLHPPAICLTKQAIKLANGFCFCLI